MKSTLDYHIYNTVLFLYTINISVSISIDNFAAFLISISILQFQPDYHLDQEYNSHNNHRR